MPRLRAPTVYLLLYNIKQLWSKLINLLAFIKGNQIIKISLFENSADFISMDNHVR